MFGEIAIEGVLVPGLLFLSVVAVMVTVLTSKLLAALGTYKLVAHRALADLSLFVLWLGLLVQLTHSHW